MSSGNLFGGALAASAARVVASNRTVTALNGIGSAAVGVKIARDGKIYVATNLAGVLLSYAQVGEALEWVSPKTSTVGDGYTIDVAVTGTLDTGAAGTGIALSSDRLFELLQVGTGGKTAEVTVTFKRGGNTLATAVYTFSVSAITFGGGL